MENNHKLIYFKNIKYLNVCADIFLPCVLVSSLNLNLKIQNIKDTFTDISLVYALN